MEILKGIVTDAQHAATVTGDGTTQGGNTVTTVHTTLLRVGGVQAKLMGASPTPIRNGDRVVLAGRRGKDGMFAALAYRNESTGVTGSEGWAARLGICIAMLAFAVPLLNTGLAPAGGATLLFMAAWCGLVGWQAVRAVQVLRAERTLQGA